MKKESTGKTEKAFVFSKKNYRLLLLGLLFLMIGYFLMSGGAAANIDEFHADEVFSFRRTILAPIIVIASYIFIGWAIFYKEKSLN